MGNQAGSLLSGKKDFPYEIGRPYADTFLWKIFEGKKKADQTRVTIFSFEITKEVSPEKLDLARNTFKRMRAIRHPAFVQYIDGVELPNMIYIVTDYVTPLPDAVRMMHADFFNEAVAWGVYSVVQGLNFLHSKRLYHGNINAPSIYVDQAGEWKIGELGFLSEIVDPNAPQPETTSPNTDSQTYGFPMRKFYSYLPHKYKSPELMSQRWDVVAQFPDKVDSFGVGCLLFEVFDGTIERTQDLKRITNKMPRPLVSAYNQLILDNPVSRLTLSGLLSNNYFNNNMVETCLFLENLSLKDPVTIETFLTNLPELLDSLPKSTCKYKILPLLINAIKFGSGGAKAIHPIFKISTMMNEEEFKSIFIPKILDLFENNDRTVRVNLLKNLGTIMPHLSQQHVEEKIYPNVAKGFKDGAPVVREMTVKSMIDIAPRLKQETVNDDLIRNLWNLQADKESSIRTNTVIAIGKLANLLDDKTRKKVLLPAFARSLRDPFLHSRLSALRALLATKEYYNVREVATKLLPVVTPLMIDNEKGVRDLAVQCTNTFLTQVTTMASAHNFDQLMAQEDGVPYTGHVGSTDSSKPPPPSPTQGDNGSYYNWAVSGVTSSVSAIKKATIGDTPPPPPRSESHAATSGYGAEPNYAPPKKQLQNPDLFQDMNVKDQPKKKPSNSLVLEHKKPTPSQPGWDDAGDVFGSNDNSYVNNFNDDAFGSDWNIEPVTKSVTAIKSSEKKPKSKAKSNNPFDDDSIDSFGSGGGWDMGGGLSPMQPKTAPQSQPLQPKRAPQSQPMQQPMQPKQNQLRTEHRPTPQGFSMQNNNNDILQPKKAPPKKKPSKDEIDWDAF